MTHVHVFVMKLRNLSSAPPWSFSNAPVHDSHFVRKIYVQHQSIKFPAANGTEAVIQHLKHEQPNALAAGWNEIFRAVLPRLCHCHELWTENWFSVDKTNILCAARKKTEITVVWKRRCASCFVTFRSNIRKAKLFPLSQTGDWASLEWFWSQDGSRQKQTRKNRQLATSDFKGCLVAYPSGLANGPLQMVCCK